MENDDNGRCHTLVHTQANVTNDTAPLTHLALGFVISFVSHSFVMIMIDIMPRPVHVLAKLKHLIFPSEWKASRRKKKKKAAVAND